MSSIESLPLLLTTAGVQTNEDFIYSLAFFYSDNVTPIDLTGISFTLTIGSLATLSTGNGGIVVYGSPPNIIVATKYAAAKASWPIGEYPMTLVATDGTYTLDVFAQSQLIVGAPSIISVVPLPTGGNMFQNVATYLPPSLANIISLQAALLALLEGAFAVNEISTSRTITTPGTYIVTATGISITLSGSWTALGSVTIKDFTGQANPNFTVTGPIDLATRTVPYSSQFQAYTFWFDPISSYWAIV